MCLPFRNRRNTYFSVSYLWSEPPSGVGQFFSQLPLAGRSVGVAEHGGIVRQCPLADDLAVSIKRNLPLNQKPRVHIQDKINKDEY